MTEKARVKKYKLNENTNDFVLYREYAALHQGEIYCVTPSANCKYLATSGDDSLVKLWDYHFRGGLTPVF